MSEAEMKVSQNWKVEKAKIEGVYLANLVINDNITLRVERESKNSDYRARINLRHERRGYVGILIKETKTARTAKLACQKLVVQLMLDIKLAVAIEPDELLQMLMAGVSACKRGK